MLTYSESDTITSISTPYSVSSLAVIRISGPETKKTLNKIFKPKKAVSDYKSHKIYYGNILENSEYIDDVMIAYMKSPKSYTGEDMAEIYCHGNIYIIDKIIQLITDKGARLSQPGEFTKRAFLNGKIDLSQAEAVDLLIKAKGIEAAKMALKNVHGELKNKISKIRKDILEIKMNIDSDIEWGETDGIAVLDRSRIIEMLDNTEKHIKDLVDSSEISDWIKSGFNLVVSGRVNAGKSSLFNRLIGQNRNIISRIPGTTRDVIEKEVIWDGISYLIYDSAGIDNNSKLKIDKISIQKTKEITDKADMVLYVIDKNKKYSEIDEKEIKRIQRKNIKIILLFNKSDLKEKVSQKIFNEKFKDIDCIEISCKNRKGIKKLLNQLKKAVKSEKFNKFMVNKRQMTAIKNIYRGIRAVKNKMRQNEYMELISYEMQIILKNLSEIDGINAEIGIFDKIFEKFCIGK